MKTFKYLVLAALNSLTSHCIIIEGQIISFTGRCIAPMWYIAPVVIVFILFGLEISRGLPHEFVSVDSVVVFVVYWLHFFFLFLSLALGGGGGEECIWEINPLMN